VIKKGSAATLQIDGIAVRADIADSFPTELIVGRQCWAGCQAPDMASSYLFGDWSYSGNDVAFYFAESHS